MSAVGRVLTAVLLAVSTLTVGPTPPAGAATWVAVNTVAGSGLASSLETWDATAVDYDGDGDQDVWVGHHDQGGRLFSNTGAGVYTRVAADAWPRINADGLVPDRHLCAWADVDRNGLVDAYCSAGRGGRNLVKTGKDNELWLQTAPGRFKEVGTAWGVGDVCGRSHYVAFLNANGDAYPDLFVGNAFPRAVTGDPCDDPANGLPSEESKLFLNSAGAGFRSVRNWGITGYGGTRCAEVVDVNRDGWDDLLVCGNTPTKLYLSNQGTGFTDVAAASGLARNHNDADFGDLDGDGDQDLVTAVWIRLEYRLNNGGTLGPPVRMYTVPDGGGGRAVSMGDADGDGDLDVYALISNIAAGTNPDDVVLRNDGLGFTPVPVPRAAGVGDAVAALDGNADGRTEFLVLNGVETSGPIQRIELRSESVSAAVTRPNIFFYNLDDLRDAFPGGIDPLRFMPKTRAWMADGRRYTRMFVADPSCCPSRAAMMTGRYPHNNGVRDQQDGPLFDGPHSMACYLQAAGYTTHLAGKFLTSWPKTSLPPCFDRSTVMWGGYRDFSVRVDGVARSGTGYSTTYLGNRGRQYLTTAMSGTEPFLLYEAPQAPHWVAIDNPDGTVSRLAVPDTQYASADVGTCSGVPEADRSDKPAYVRTMNHTPAQAQEMCQSQLRAIMSADDEFAATMQLLADGGVLDSTLVILSSDNGYMWGEHGRWEKFVPYEPSIRVPLLIRWPGHIAAGTNTTRLVSSLDLLPTMLQAAGIALPEGAPPLDGESLLRATRRTSMYGEYYVDGANPNIPSWRMIRTATTKYVETYDAQGSSIAREYYRLGSDPAENINALGDASATNDPSAGTLLDLATRLDAFASCAGASCLQ